MNCKSPSSRNTSTSRSTYLSPDLSALRKLFASPNTKAVYGYVVRTISLEQGLFHQHGCGPNWEGGVITLCTCKGYMRTYHDAEEWAGLWIAGFSGSTATPGCNALVYLMQIGQAFESFADLWNGLPSQARATKSSVTNPHGDLYEPTPNRMVDASCRYKPINYQPPRPDHSHAKPDPKNPSLPSWHGDISKEYKGRRPSLLVGDPRKSFVWRQPLIELAKERIGRGCKKWNTMQEFVSDLVAYSGVLPYR